MHVKNFITAGLLTAGLVMSASSFADVKPTVPFCFAGTGCNHPDQAEYAPYIDSILYDIKGEVKQVIVKSGKTADTYLINKQGLISSKSDKYGQDKYEYDDQNRITSIKKYYEKGKSGWTDKFTYFDDKNMVIDKTFDEKGKWKKSSVRVLSKDNSEGNAYYQISATPTNLYGVKYILTPNGNEWRETGLQNSLEKYPSNETEAESIFLSALNCLKNNDCSYGLKILLNVNITKKSKDDEYDKFFSSGATSWFKNGLINETASKWTEPLSDGSKPHTIFKYQFDEKGNWIVREQWINDIPGTITDPKPQYRKVDKETVTRKIEYYQ